MDFFFTRVDETAIDYWEQFLNDWFFVFALVFLAVELVRYGVKKKLTWSLMGDAVTNYITLGAFILLSTIVFGAFFVFSYFYLAQFAILDIQINWLTVCVCVVLADLVYYWAHRFMHRVNLAWATHTVHHSSPYFNISVAYRFGPMDGFWPIFFHIPLILLGFNPFVVIFSEMFVQLYQTILHTEMFKKLPRPIEAIMNTPSHHRVHHGSNDAYLDANYAGIFIIWDRMFGTFAEEQEEVVYGLVKPINSINPFIAFFHGFWRLGQSFLEAPGLRNKLMTLFAAPDWSASSQENATTSNLQTEPKS